jgi:hypothetical protein
MHSQLKKRWVAGGLGACLVLSGVSASAAPQVSPMLQVRPVHAQQHVKHHGRYHKRMSVQRSWHKALRPYRHYTVAQARLITQAAILLAGQPDMKVKTIDTVKNKRGREFYRITIVGAPEGQRMVLFNPANGRLRTLHQQR